MLASEGLIEALNRQIGREMGASMQYISIASYFATETLTELGRFFYRQADEERDHAMRFVKFIVEVDGQVRVPEIAAPQSDFSSAAEAVGKALKWEEEVTRQIYELVDIAQNDSNYIAVRFLDWFVTEQLEEVATMSGLLAVVERAGESGLLHVEEFLAREGQISELGPPAG